MVHYVHHAELWRVEVASLLHEFVGEVVCLAYLFCSCNALEVARFAREKNRPQAFCCLLKHIMQLCDSSFLRELVDTVYLRTTMFCHELSEIIAVEIKSILRELSVHLSHSHVGVYGKQLPNLCEIESFIVF